MASNKLEEPPSFTRFRGVSDSFCVTLEDVLRTPSYRHILQQFLETQAYGHSLPFLEAVDTFVHSIPAPNADASVQVEVADEADDGASISSLRLSAKSLFGRFFEAPEVEAQLHLHSRFGESIQAAIASWGDAGDDLVDEEDAVRPLFDEASRHVHGVLATEYFPRFLESDHYIAMMTRRLDEHLGTADPAEEDDAVLTLPAGGLDPVDSPEPSAFDPAHGRRPSHRGWVNDRGFKSVHVDVLAARNLRDGFMGSNPDAYCCVWLDTTCFRNSVVSGSNPNWDEATDDSHFEFPLRPTSLHASIEVFDHQLMRHDKHLGSISIQVVDVFQQYYALQNGVADALAGGDDAPDPEDGEDEFTRWHTIRKPGDGASDAPKARGEILVRVTLSQAEANPDLHKPITRETANMLSTVIRQKVSKKKRRFQQDGFDLDLTYITDRVIAMGYPSQKFESIYRNDLQTIKRFFNHRHEDHYYVYNLCSEREYDPSLFADKVIKFGFDDHNPCPFGMLQEFCDHVHDWLAQHPQNIAAIHCKAGKGRTGLVIACYMVYTGLFPSAVSALKYYAYRRTKNRKGVTIPSQIRYVHYFERYLKYERMMARARTHAETLSQADVKELRSGSARDLLGPLDMGGQGEEHDRAEQEQKAAVAARVLGFQAHRRMSLTERTDVYDYLHMRNTLVTNNDGQQKRGGHFLPDEDKHHVIIQKIVLHKLPLAASQDGANIFFVLKNRDLDIEYSSKGKIQPSYDADKEQLTFDIAPFIELTPESLELFGDILIVFYATTMFGGKTKVCQIWLNSRFLVSDGYSVHLTKPEIDKVNKDKKHKIVPSDFAMDLDFKPPERWIGKQFAKLDAIDEQYEQFHRQLMTDEVDIGAASPDDGADQDDDDE